METILLSNYENLLKSRVLEIRNNQDTIFVNYNYLKREYLLILIIINNLRSAYGNKTGL